MVVKHQRRHGHDQSGRRRNERLGHTGGQKAFVTFIYFRPENGTAAIAAFNTVPNRAVAGLASDLFDNVFSLFPDA